MTLLLPRGFRGTEAEALALADAIRANCTCKTHSVETGAYTITRWRMCAVHDAVESPRTLALWLALRRDAARLWREEYAPRPTTAPDITLEEIITCPPPPPPPPSPSD